MAIELVTAYKGKDHVTAEQWADFNRGIYGDAAILPVGNKMETAIQTANQITVKDGVAVIDGRQVYIGYGESENIAIQSGTQGKLRRDIVVLEYKKEEVSGVETVQFKVITGTPADSDVKDPSVQDMDIRTGVFTSQKPFCRVRLNGTAIEGVDTLIPVKEFKSHAFAAPVNNLTGTNPDLALAATQGREIKKQIDALNSAFKNALNGIEMHCTHLTANQPAYDEAESIYYLPTELPTNKTLPIGYKSSGRHGWTYEFYTSGNDTCWRICVKDNNNTGAPSGYFSGYMVWVEHNDLTTF